MHVRRHSNPNYSDFWWIRNFVQPRLAVALGINESELESLKFDGIYNYCDVYVAREFEGLPNADSSVWDENSYTEMRSM